MLCRLQHLEQVPLRLVSPRHAIHVTPATFSGSGSGARLPVHHCHYHTSSAANGSAASAPPPCCPIRPARGPAGTVYPSVHRAALGREHSCVCCGFLLWPFRTLPPTCAGLLCEFSVAAPSFDSLSSLALAVPLRPGGPSSPASSGGPVPASSSWQPALFNPIHSWVNRLGSAHS